MQDDSSSSTTHSNFGGSLKTLPLCLLILMVLNIIVACDDEKKEVISGKVDPELTPTMTTHDVNTVISDSGITRYRIVTPLWYIYDEAQEPTWRFPEGVFLEKFDEKFRQEATIRCDSATYFKNKQLWRLDGYVDIKNTIGEKFLTNQLYWDQRQQKIYSDSFIHIERQHKVIEGYGFESNEQMTRYDVLRVSAIFPASQFSPDSTKRNSGSDIDNMTPSESRERFDSMRRANPQAPTVIITSNTPVPSRPAEKPQTPRADKPAPDKPARQLLNKNR